MYQRAEEGEERNFGPWFWSSKRGGGGGGEFVPETRTLTKIRKASFTVTVTVQVHDKYFTRHLCVRRTAITVWKALHRVYSHR